MSKVKRVSVVAQSGYDLWADTYDQTPNPLVALDAIHTISRLAPKAGERILDAGCGTGRNIQALLDRGAEVEGVDFSSGMLKMARTKYPELRFTQAALDELPHELTNYDAILCALVGEHLDNTESVFTNLYSALRPTGRIVFSVYHPWLAAAGVEANFTLGEIEYRLGAETHTIEDYSRAMAASGFRYLDTEIYHVDEKLVSAVPRAGKYLGKPLLVVISARKDQT
jgi:SAM-dependent methyltransferase